MYDREGHVHAAVSVWRPEDSLWSQFSPTFTWVSGVEFRSSGLYHKYFQPLSHLPSSTSLISALIVNYHFEIGLFLLFKNPWCALLEHLLEFCLFLSQVLTALNMSPSAAFAVF